MQKSAKIFGKKLDPKNIEYTLPQGLLSKFEIKTCIEVSTTRSENRPNQILLDGDELIALHFNDDTEWIGHPADIQDIYDEKTIRKRTNTNDDYLFEGQISESLPNTRGSIKRALVKLFVVFKPKTLANATMNELASAYDKKTQPNTGLYTLDFNFNRKLFKKNTYTPATYLLLLHGTISTSVDAFSDLNNKNNTWNEIISLYNNNIIALEHYTLSVSPLQNALDFLTLCPDSFSIDILSHSRGGLVADILAKCDHRNTTIGFSNNELDILKNHDKEAYKLMLDINRLSRKKQITIGKVIRVASPSSGTTILSRRVDHFFNLVLNAISLAVGIRNPLYELVKSFLLELICQKEDPEALPGLNSMMPESLFQKMLNASDTSVTCKLYTISGDSDISGINFNTLKVILANLFYQGANDLVVDTKRMEDGIKPRDGYFTFLSKGGNTNHFKYFSNNDSCQAILQALKASKNNPSTAYSKKVNTDGQRGIVFDLLSLEGISFKPKKITRDVIILIPGIMGSTLSHNGDEQWVDMREINKGSLVKNLNISSTKVEPSGVLKKYYSKLADYLAKDYDVISLEFDWRKSLKDSAKKLQDLLQNLLTNKNTVHIVAHSMGGLVARQCMMSYPKTWESFKKDRSNKLVLLGTPWRGSYLIMEVLTGHSRRVKQLAFIDFKHDKRDLLKIFWKYPGIFELLPIEADNNRPFWDTKFWEELQGAANLKDMPPIKNNKKSLNDFKAYRKSVLDFLETINNDETFLDNVYYICGKDDKTVFDYRLKNKFLSQKKKLVYKATSQGDGSVTWSSGIPNSLAETNKNLYYSHTTHGELANEPYIFEGISDILAFGKTKRLNIHPPLSRSGEIITEVHEFPEPLSNTEAVVKAIFDTYPTSKTETEAINVRVVHGDLKASSYPVMVGHFFMDLILSAEKALDEYLDNRLSQRLGIGYYPGKIGESEVFFNLNTQPKGAIICGLGNTDTLTPFLLAKTIKLATLRYAMFMRDNYTLPKAKNYARGISLVLMGTGYGKLPIEDSIRGILLGISNANKYIQETGEGLKTIEQIEIINYYESVSSQAYFCLNRLEGSDNRIAINLEKGISCRAGAKKKQLFSENTYEWWHNLIITSIIDKTHSHSFFDSIDGFKYNSSSGLARVEQEMIGIGLNKIYHLLEEQSKHSKWDKRLSKTLFEMLVPNDFKNVIRNQTNVILKIDKNAAQIPWELLHDSNTDTTPAAVSSGFIRQLITTHSESFNTVELHNNNAFIVGDPKYNQPNLSPLPAAKAEAEWVNDQLLLHGFKTTALINKGATTIMMELYNNRYKIMHFAGHGLYDPENDAVGIAIGNGICIDPAMIKQLSYVPEFVFINCCYSGVMNAEDDTTTRQRYKLAANIGTMLIEMGVKAIVISGWAVNDAAAKTFSDTFYTKMFQGYNFGNAIQIARKKCYQNHLNTNTWAAYQCYGNQFYKFNTRNSSKKTVNEYVVASQVHIDLDNLLISIRDKKTNNTDTLKKLSDYLDRAEQANLLDALVLEKEALIYDELGQSDIALEKFIELFSHASGNYSSKALEQYCVLKSHKFTKEQVSADLNEINLLTMVGRNPKRLNIVGNAYKLAAKFQNDKASKIKELKKAYEFYKESYNACNDKYCGEYLDAVSNMILIGHILEKMGDDKLLKRIKDCKAFEEVSDLDLYLTEFHKELDDFDKSDLDISVLIGMTEISYGLMLINSKFKDKIEHDIVAWYKDIFELLYSPRYINIEISQIDFLLYYITDKHIIEQLEFIKNELKKLL